MSSALRLSLCVVTFMGAAPGQLVEVGPVNHRACGEVKVHPNLALTVQTRLAGHLEDTSSAAMIHTRLELRTYNTELNQTLVKEVQTDTDGNFSFGLTAAGRYRLVIFAPGFKQAVDLKCLNGKRCTLPIRLEVAPVNRAQTATESGGWSEGFSYDQFGNMWVSSYSGISVTPATPTTQSFYSASNNRFTGVGYDGVGNQLTALYPTTSTFSYDAENRQKSAYNTTNGTSTYTYDGDGHRVTKVVGSTTTTFVYDALGRLASEYSSAQSVPDCTTCYLVVAILNAGVPCCFR
jgi:uncharacterized protein RhaS with RHS repeats